MKQYIGAAIIFASIILLGWNSKQQEQTYSVRLTLPQWNDYLQVIEDAKLEGDTRRFLRKQIVDQIQPQIDAAQKIQQAKDSTGKKKQ